MYLCTYYFFQGLSSDKMSAKRKLSESMSRKIFSFLFFSIIFYCISFLSFFQILAFVSFMCSSIEAARQMHCC